MKHAPRAIIVGGGIGGPAVSLFLQRAGIESEIFEAYPEPATIGGGFQIAPNGMRVLKALGLADQVAAAGVPSSDFVFRNRGGQIISAANDRRQLNELGPFGQWMRDRMFPLLAPMIGRELQRQYSAIQDISGTAA